MKFIKKFTPFLRNIGPKNPQPWPLQPKTFAPNPKILWPRQIKLQHSQKKTFWGHGFGYQVAETQGFGFLGPNIWVHNFEHLAKLFGV